LVTREPDPQLEDAAAESVTREFRERMFMVARTVLSRRECAIQVSPRLRVSQEK
jgi:hypothetical protein